MRVSSAFLCDAASVRENLLHVLGGGITRLFRSVYPAPIDISLAALLEVEPSDVGQHQISVRIMSSTDEQLSKIDAKLEAQLIEDTRGLPFFMPLVVGLRGAITDPGDYRVQLAVDDHEPRILHFRVELPATAPAVSPDAGDA